MLRGTSLLFRPLERAHLARWQAWVNEPEVAALLDRVLPVTEDEHRAFYQQSVVDNRHAVWFALHTLDDDVYIGNVWLWNINHRHSHAEVRIVIGESQYRQRGAGTEALMCIAQYALRSLGLHKVYAYVMERNLRARMAFEKAGFEVEATLKEECFWEGGYQDVWRLARCNGAA